MLVNEKGAAKMPAQIDHVRLDCISRVDETHELWWVALQYTDESTQPEGMFAEKTEARALAEKLAAREAVDIVETSFV